MSTTRYPSSDNELMLYRVLQRANLVQYYEAFISQGGDDVNQLCEAGEEEFLEIMALVGMASKPLHVRRLQKTLLEWILDPATFCKPLQDRRVTPAVASKGSIYAALQHDQTATPRVLNGNSTMSSCDIGGHDARGLQPSMRHESMAQNHRVTPNSDDASDPDLTVNSSYEAGMIPTPVLFHSPSSILSEEQMAVLAAATESLAKTLQPYAPKPLNMKKPIDKEIQEAMNCLEDDASRLDISRRYAAIYGRFDSKRPPNKPMNFHEMCVNEAAAQLCRHRPSLLTRRDDLFNLALRIVKDVGFQSLRPGPSPAYSVATATSLMGPASKQPRIESPSMSASNSSSTKSITAQSNLLKPDDHDSMDNSVCSVVDGSADCIPMDTQPPSLVDEGLRIARQYGLGEEFESELEGLKKAAAAQDTVGEALETEGSTSEWNNGTGVADNGMIADSQHLTT